ncbi:MAG TPA: pyruvate, phosphate dikinase [Rhizomicrobium sp.]
MTKWVYTFGNGSAEGDAGMTALLGGKGANLAEMSALGLPVPPGFTITTEACAFYHANNRTFPPGLKEQVSEALARLGTLGDPLLVAVRSGAPTSMPGMMDTILNLGLTDRTVEALAQRDGAGFADDCYRRLKQMYADAVPDAPLPQEPQVQLWGAIGAVLESWNSPRAIAYRRMFDIPDTPGTAVTIQAMVFGNRGAASASGVAFTRDPATGEKRITGEYLPGKQGEDLVSGVVTPLPLAELVRGQPKAFAELCAIAANLEAHFRDMQDFEFTLEQGRLYILQTREGKRTARAMLKIAVDMAGEGLIDRHAAVARIDAAALAPLLHPVLDAEEVGAPLTCGLGASPGAAAGEIVFTAEEAMERAGHDVILVRGETSPHDIRGLQAARGILTAHGGASSHAATLARAMGLPCVTGAGMLDIDASRGTLRIGDVQLRRGDIITIDGASGFVFSGRMPMRAPELSADFETLMNWAEEILAGNMIAAEKGHETRDAAIGSASDSLRDSAASSPHSMSILRLMMAQAALTSMRETI